MKDIRKRALDMFRVGFKSQEQQNDLSIDFFKELFFYNSRYEALDSLLSYGMIRTASGLRFSNEKLTFGEKEA